MLDRTPDQEQFIIDSEVRRSRSVMRVEQGREILERSDDVLRDTRHRRRRADDEQSTTTDISQGLLPL
jgi:hypothetical protein